MIDNNSIIDSFQDNYAFLSNFHPHPLTISGVTYPTNEHAFQAAKTTDPQQRRYIAEAQAPKAAEQRGREIHLRPGWGAYLRYTVMEYLIGKKFIAESALARMLIDTGNAVLIEGNARHDNLWGDCRCGRSSCEPVGANILGWMLMKRRAELMR
ncbi:MAG: NADAR family protein [Candidatus Binatia bacterium]